MSSVTAPTVAFTDDLALIFQEPLTAIVRLRANRQALSDAETFRYHMREALKAAVQSARDRGYNNDDIRMATLAVVGFLDESVLNTGNPLFADWPRKPLQEELFGIHMAGEVFFQNVDQLLTRQDSVQLADVLEVHYLCLLLGYRGRYSGRAGGDIQSVLTAIATKIRRIRGPLPSLSPSWAPAAEQVRSTGDPWVRRLLIAAAVALALMLTLFVVFKISLNSGADDLRSMSALRK